MEKNPKNYLKTGAFVTNDGITNIGSEYYQIKKTIYDLSKKKPADIEIDRKLDTINKHEGIRIQKWGGRDIPI